jgi:hypothetical protein
MPVSIDTREPTKTLRDPKRNLGWWVDDEGTFQKYRVSANDRREALNETDPFPDGVGEYHALHNLGMIRIERAGQGARLSWDVAAVERVTLDAVADRVGRGAHGAPISLNFWYGGWAREQYSDPREAVRRMLELDEFRNDPPNVMIASAEHRIQNLATAKPLLREAHARWRESVDRRLEAFDGPFHPMSRFALVFSESAASGGFQYRSVGRRAHIVSYLGRDWAREVIGKPSTRGHADVEFETVISEPYFETLRTEEPHYGHVRAVFEVHGREREWVSYQRLILPFVAANGARAIAIMVAPDQDVSIPFPAPK